MIELRIICCNVCIVQGPILIEYYLSLSSLNKGENGFIFSSIALITKLNVLVQNGCQSSRKIKKRFID